MQLLLDTQVLLWALAGDERLGDRAIDLIEDGRNVVYVSAASIWEISIKRSLGKLRVPGDVLAEVDAASFIRLPISFEHADTVAALPDLHADPFDRMLVAQASADRLVLMTHDPLVLQYDIETFEV
jgi:PIN domain nuclease of toxin-antitoxin system